MQNFCTSPQHSTCGNARFQLIKLCNKYKKEKRIAPKLEITLYLQGFQTFKKELQEL